MSHAAVLRAMIDQRERELAALRDALEMMEAVDGQTAAFDALDAKPHRTRAPAALSGHTPQIDSQQAVMDAIRALGSRTSVAEIAARAGLRGEMVRQTIRRLVTDGRVRAEGWARGRQYILSDSASTPQPPPVSPLKGARSDSTPKDAPKRRFTTGHGDLEPAKVHGLPSGHPALISARTLFPSTVVEAKDSPRLLVSGANQRKLGDRVTKGLWAGMPIYALTLEERATCPTTCHHWKTCFGNGMPLARRHRHGAELEQRLASELAAKQSEHPAGFVVRLHVLGDFYSLDYVAAWGKWLTEFSALRVFGYTAWQDDTEIGQLIGMVRNNVPDRFAIRTSRPWVESETHRKDAATTIWRVAEGKQPEGIVCPAQTHPGVCCGSCGLCWHPKMRTTPIAFIAHGRKSEKSQDAAGPAPKPATEPAMSRHARVMAFGKQIQSIGATP